MNQPQAPQRTLGLFDAICIIVGTIVGAGIFQTSPMIASLAGSPVNLGIVWFAGAFIALIGAICFAELTHRYPDRVGGDYVYLKQALGPTVSFLFAWSSFWVVRPGNIGAMAMVFAVYFSQINLGVGVAQPVWAIAAVTGLSVVNLIGLQSGKRIQNVLTIAKVAGICSIVFLAFVSPAETPPDAAAISVGPTSASSNLWIAILFVMFTFGGWNDISFVAGEIRDPRRNLWRCLMLGIVIVTVVYSLFNFAILTGLGFTAMSQSSAVATDLVTQVLGDPFVCRADDCGTGLRLMSGIDQRHDPDQPTNLLCCRS